MRVLLVEDDPHTTRAVSLMLQSAGAVSDAVATGEDGLELARHYAYDVVVLDLMLPDIEGYDVVRRMRAAKVNAPILILSGLSQSEAKVRCLAAGADDFVTKPFDRSELLARIQAVLRRSCGLSQSVLRMGDLEINLHSKEVTVGQRSLHLTAKEYQILELLALRRGVVLTKAAFLDHLYNGIDEPQVKIVDVFICKLRRKLAAAGVTDLIATSWGHGYILRGSVTVAADAPKPRQPAPVVWSEVR